MGPTIVLQIMHETKCEFSIVPNEITNYERRKNIRVKCLCSELEGKRLQLSSTLVSYPPSKNLDINTKLRVLEECNKEADYILQIQLMNSIGDTISLKNVKICWPTSNGVVYCEEKDFTIIFQIDTTPTVENTTHFSVNIKLDSTKEDNCFQFVLPVYFKKYKKKAKINNDDNYSLFLEPTVPFTPDSRFSYANDYSYIDNFDLSVLDLPTPLMSITSLHDQASTPTTTLNNINSPQYPIFQFNISNWKDPIVKKCIIVGQSLHIVLPSHIPMEGVLLIYCFVRGENKVLTFQKSKILELNDFHCNRVDRSISFNMFAEDSQFRGWYYCFWKDMWEGIHLLSSIYVVESAETLRIISGSILEDPASLALILKNDN